MQSQACGKAKRYFLGKHDPNKILLESVFPCSDITFSAPIHEEGKRPRVVIEGNSEHLEILENHLEELVANAPTERFFGRWMVVTPDEITNGLALFYDPLSREINKVELLVFVLRRHLVKVCDLHLAAIGVVTATWDCFDINFGTSPIPNHPLREARIVPLPEEIGNGKIELPIIIIPGANKKTLN